MLKQAKETFSEIKSSYPSQKDLICTDLTISTPQLNKKFDLISMMSALHWLYPDEQKIMNWIHTQMDSCGDFIFTSYHPHENYNQVGGTDLIVLETIKRLGIYQNKLNNFILMSTRTRSINDIHRLISPWFLVKQIETKEATMYINNTKEYVDYHIATFGSYYLQLVAPEEQNTFLRTMGEVAMERMRHLGFVTHMKVAAHLCTPR